jgi:hypothetical protein
MMKLFLVLLCVTLKHVHAQFGFGGFGGKANNQQGQGSLYPKYYHEPFVYILLERPTTVFLRILGANKSSLIGRTMAVPSAIGRILRLIRVCAQ